MSAYDTFTRAIRQTILNFNDETIRIGFILSYKTGVLSIDLEPLLYLSKDDLFGFFDRILAYIAH